MMGRQGEGITLRGGPAWVVLALCLCPPATAFAQSTNDASPQDRSASPAKHKGTKKNASTGDEPAPANARSVAASTDTPADSTAATTSTAPAATAAAAPPPPADTSKKDGGSLPNVPPFTLDAWSVEAGGAIATDNSYSAGLMLRAGRTFTPQVYLGVGGEYWFPSVQSAGIGGAQINASGSAFDVLGLIGYDWGVSDIVVIRPLGGLGVIHTEASICSSFLGAPTQCVNGKDTNAAGTFGVEVLVQLKPVEVGGEIRGLFASGSSTALFGAHVGMTF
jgi:hypothetical protein